MKRQTKWGNNLKLYIIFIILTGEVSEWVWRCEIPIEKNMLLEEKVLPVRLQFIKTWLLKFKDYL